MTKIHTKGKTSSKILLAIAIHSQAAKSQLAYDYQREDTSTCKFSLASSTITDMKPTTQ